MPPASSSSRLSASSNDLITWRPTKIMNMRDLSKDDDFLSHLLVEKLGTGTVPLLVHKMDSSRRLPKTDTHILMKIVRRLVVSKSPLQQVVRQAVDELLTLPPIRYYLKPYNQKQINAFATHASRYFELYHPSGSIEIAHTSRYSHHTGKSELCILATRNLAPGTVITELKGSMANLTDEEDKELKRTDLRNSDIRRDFSVIHSKSMKKNHLFLGPARFVNHDCDHNCELFREGRYITFRVLRPIAIGEEITAHYGDGYFGKKNRHCLCETCEKNGRGGYSPDHQDDPVESSSSSSSGSDSDSDSDSDTSSSSSESDVPQPVLNMNERRTRRGVYAITKPRSESSDDSDNEEEDEDSKVPSADAKVIPGDIELTAELDTGSDLTSLAPSMPSSDGASPDKRSTVGLLTPTRDKGSRSSSSLTELTSSTGRSITPKSTQSTPFRSIIATRRQKAQISTNMSPSSSVEPSPKRITRSVSSLISSAKKGKGKATPTPISTPRSGRAPKATGKDDVKIKKEEVEARVLRVRPSIAAPEVAKEPPSKPEVPLGPDGKPLPTCSTCRNVLPLIEVDSKIVWGLGINTLLKKKKYECPRCIRHFAIYQQTWPCRIGAPGSMSMTPEEDTPPPEVITKKVTKKGLHILNRKLAAAAAAASASAASNKGRGKKRPQDEEEEQEEPVLKRRKLADSPVRKNDTSISRGKPIRTYSSNAKKAKRAASPEPPEVEKRKPGRPRVSSPIRAVKPKVKVEEPAEQEASLLRQPRSMNGRFGKKSPKKGVESKSQPSSSRNRPENSDHEGNSSPQTKTTSLRRKRSSGDLEDAEESPRKKTVSDDKEPEMFQTAQRVLPRPASGFRGGRLFSNPNPLQFALYAWAGPVILDESSSSDDEKHPETPEDDHSVTASVASPEEESVPFFPLRTIVSKAPLSYKPSPHSFGARHRWGRLKHSVPSNIDIPSLQLDSEPLKTPSLNTDVVISPVSETSSTPSSPDDSLPPTLRQIYPVLPPATGSNSYVPKSTHFPPSTSGTKPTFINAGWDDGSDASEA